MDFLIWIPDMDSLFSFIPKNDESKFEQKAIGHFYDLSLRFNSNIAIIFPCPIY